MKNSKIYIGIGIAILLISSIRLFMVSNQKSELENSLKAEKSRTESLQSTQSVLEKDKLKLTDQLSSLQRKNADMEKDLTGLKSTIQSKEAQIQKLTRQSDLWKSKNREISELKARGKELEQNIASFELSISKLQSENQDLKGKNELLITQNTQLTEQLKLASSRADAIRVETVRGKRDKLVAKAGRTQRIKAIFEIPTTTEEINYKIIDPEKKSLPITASNLTTKILSENLKREGSQAILKQIEVTYKAAGLKAGIYTIEIQSQNKYLNSFQFRLR